MELQCHVACHDTMSVPNITTLAVQDYLRNPQETFKFKEKVRMWLKGSIITRTVLKLMSAEGCVCATDGICPLLTSLYMQLECWSGPYHQHRL